MKKLVCLILFYGYISAQDTLIIHNETAQKLYVALYMVPQIGGKVHQKTAIAAIEPGRHVEIKRPHLQVAFDRQLAYSSDPYVFAKEFPSKRIFDSQLLSINVGLSHGKEYWFAQENGKISGYYYATWKLKHPLKFASEIQKKISEIGEQAVAVLTDNWLVQKVTKNSIGVVVTAKERFKDAVKSRYPGYWKSLYEKTKATVRISPTIASGEQVALHNRIKYVEQALTSKLETFTKTPKIAVVTSGGGYRAMALTMGFLVGAQKTGLLDSITWISSLSGSTWAIATWMQNALKEKDWTPEKHRERLFKIIDNKVLQQLSKNDYRLISNLLLVDAMYEKPFTTVNLFGALLANLLLENFKDEKQYQRLSVQADVVSNGHYPLPIYTTISGEAGKREKYWYAFTPWEVSLEPSQLQGNGISIPTWGLGRYYDQGFSIAYAPEQSLGFNLGCFGSAYAAEFQVIYQEIAMEAPSKLVKTIIDQILFQIGEYRLSYGCVPNFMKGIQSSPFSHQNFLLLVDAGHAFNLPYPPVSGLRAERTPDIIIFIDGSADIAQGNPNEFIKVINYARAKNLPFPEIDTTALMQHAINIFKDDSDPSIPTIIYMPWVKDEELFGLLQEKPYQIYKEIEDLDLAGCCLTYKGTLRKFGAYTYAEVMQLSKLMEFNTVVNADLIWQEIAQKAT